MVKKKLNLLKSIREILAIYTGEDEMHWIKLNKYKPENFAKELLATAKEGEEEAEAVLASLIEARMDLEEGLGEAGDGPGKGWWGAPKGTHGDGKKGEDMTGWQGKPRVLSDREFLVIDVGNKQEGGRRASGFSDSEVAIIRKSISGINLPAHIGKSIDNHVTIRNRRPPKSERHPELAFTNGLQIFLNRLPDTFSNLSKLKNTFAHEFGHVSFTNPVRKAFEAKFGKGPYPKGRFGITSIYHLQNSSELFSNLFGKYATGGEVPSAISDFLQSDVFS